MRTTLHIPVSTSIGSDTYKRTLDIELVFSSGKIKQFISNRKLTDIIIEDVSAINDNLEHLIDLADIVDWLFPQLDNDVQNRFGAQSIRLESIVVSDGINTIGVRRD